MMNEKYLVISLYFAVLFLLGMIASRRIRGLKDFYVGGKKLGYWVVAFSAMATGESAWLLLGLTGMGALMGVKAFWIVVGEVLGVGLVWISMSRKIKWITDKYESITVPDYLVARFQCKTHLLRALSAFVLTTFVIIYSSAQIDAIGKAFETFFSGNYFVGAIIGFGFVVVYICAGGFVAVAWSDLFQGLMMFFGLVVLPIAAFFSIPKLGFSLEWVEGLRRIDPSLLDIWGRGGFSALNLMTVIGFVMIGVPFLGSPQIMVRFISIKDESEIPKGTVVGVLFTLMTDSAAVLAGMLGRYILTGSGQDVSILGNGAENVLPLLVELIFPAVLVGLYIAAILAAIMSTIDSLLVLASSAITRDCYQQIFHPELEDRKLSRLSRSMTFLLAAIALGVALTVAVLSPTRTIFWFVLFGWFGLAATFCPVIILSLFWKKYTEKAAIVSMFTGFLCIPLFKFVVPKFPVVGEYVRELSELPLSIVIATLVGILISLAQGDPNLEESYSKTLEQYKRRSER
jgi:sodium/proline symporter